MRDTPLHKFLGFFKATELKLMVIGQIKTVNIHVHHDIKLELNENDKDANDDD